MYTAVSRGNDGCLSNIAHGVYYKTKNNSDSLVFLFSTNYFFMSRMLTVNRLIRTIYSYYENKNRKSRKLLVS